MRYSKYWIADSGGTKTDWVLCAGGTVVFRHTTEGLHPRYLHSRTEAQQAALTEVLKQDPDAPLFFYGAGCSQPETAAAMHSYLTATGFTSVTVFPDSLGTCRALLQQEAGTVAILGTGSIVLCYNGNEITRRFGGFGPLLGDEGSGVHFARLVLRDYLNNRLQSAALEEAVGTQSAVLAQLASPDAVYWLAGVGRMLAHLPLETYHQQNLEDWLHTGFLEHITDHTLSVTGSYGFAHGDRLRALLKSRGIHLQQLVASPLEGLIQYHQLH